MSVRYRDLAVWKRVLRETGVSRPGAFERTSKHAPPTDDGGANAVFAGRKLVADISSSAGKGCRAPSSAADGVRGGNQRRTCRVPSNRAILHEERLDIYEWVDVVPTVQWALNTAYRERYANPPSHVMFGRAPLTSFSTLASSTGEDWKVDALDGERTIGGERCEDTARTAQGG